MKHPYTSTTVLIERLTCEEYEENDYGGIPELIESIKLQDSGPREASRAIRKKLKYGNVHRQLRALTLLDALISNAGPRFQRTFADEPLLERLRIAASEASTDPDVRAKLKILFSQWAREYKTTTGLGSIASLHQQFPQRRRPVPKPAAAMLTKQQTPPPTPVSPVSPSSSTQNSRGSSPPVLVGGGWRASAAAHKKSLSKSSKKPFNLEKEKPALNNALANASIASTNLMNSLKLINREKERPSEKREVVQNYEACKSYRASILRYIQFVESEQWLGGLIHAHEELGAAIGMYEQYDKPIDEDSDSEDEEEWAGADVARRMAGMRLDNQDASPPSPSLPSMPSRPKGKEVVEVQQEEEEEDDDPDDPFGNQYAVHDDESKPGMKWREV